MGILQEEEEEEEICACCTLECLGRLEFPGGTRVFDAQASPHFDVVEVGSRNYQVPASQ